MLGTTLFPVGFHSVRPYHSVRSPSTRTEYSNRIVEHGDHGPLFTVTAADDPDTVYSAASASACWATIVKAVQTAKGKADGRSAVSGLEHFGVSHPVVKKLVNNLPGARDVLQRLLPDLTAPTTSSTTATTSTSTTSTPAKSAAAAAVAVAAAAAAANAANSQTGSGHAHVSLRPSLASSPAHSLPRAADGVSQLVSPRPLTGLQPAHPYALPAGSVMPSSYYPTPAVSSNPATAAAAAAGLSMSMPPTSYQQQLMMEMLMQQQYIYMQQQHQQHHPAHGPTVSLIPHMQLAPTPALVASAVTAAMTTPATVAAMPTAAVATVVPSSNTIPGHTPVTTVVNNATNMEM
jgi:hypothetical protein